MSKGRVLVLDDEQNMRKVLGAMLRAEGYEVATASNLAEARAHVLSQMPHVALSDLRLANENGLQFLRWMREENFLCPVIILTAHGTVDSAVDAMKQGAFDYLSKPFERSEINRVIDKAFLVSQYQRSNFIRSGPGIPGISMVGNSEQMHRVYNLVEKVAGTDSTVLITGESGTGKELVAQAIHNKSGRVDAPFIKINCAAIPEKLMESELFGYEKGAFTGAGQAKPGRFELADNGTLFLDEVGEMTTEMQVKLLRVLQDRRFERVGGLRTLEVNVRLIAASNQDLQEAARQGTFREDLFYRLNVVPIGLPPLRDRPDDIPMLIAYFVEKFSERMHKDIPEISTDALEALIRYEWPGNIRQLENVVERLLVMHEGGPIEVSHLPEEVMDAPLSEEIPHHSSHASLKEQVKEVTRKIEKRAIEHALTDTDNNVTQAARKLNISRKGLQLKMKELGIR